MLQYIRIESFQRSLFIDVPIFRINYFYKIRLFSSESTALKSIVQQRGVRLIFVQGCQRECGGRSDLKRQSSSSRYISKFGKAVTSAVLREKKNKEYQRNFLCLSSHISMVMTNSTELSLKSNFIANVLYLES